MLPNFIVIGAQKAGSTFVQQGLQDHPQIYMPRGETPFFQDPDYQAHRLDELEQLFVDHHDKHALGIKRPNYLGETEVAPRIAADLPGVKLIAVLRDPSARAISAYFHSMRSGGIPVEPLETGLPKVIDRQYSDRWPAAEKIIRYGLYHEHLSTYLNYFDRDHLHIVIMDDVKTRPLEVMKDLYRFLGVCEDFTPQRMNQRPMASIYSLTRLRIGQAFRPLHSQFNADHTRVYRRPGKIAYGLQKATGGLDRYVLSRLLPANKPAVSADLKHRLNELYRDDVNRLRSLVDRDLEGWPK